jgi:hypothetical protein
MPRQPFLPEFAHLQYAVGALVLNDRPELSAAIGRCIAIWSQADNEMGNLFSVLLGAGSDAALDVFLTLRRSANQREALGTAAKAALRGRDLKLVEGMLKLYGSLEKERNALAHGCFGVAGNDPSVLLWIDIRDHVHFQTEVLAQMASGKTPADPHARLRKNMFVYRTSDLQSLQRDMEHFWKASQKLNSYLRLPSRSPESEAFRQLVTLPLVDRILAD